MIQRSRLLVGGVLLLVLAVVAGCGSRWLAGGKLHFDQQRFDRALENFQSAVAEQPENGEAHLWLGRALAELERDEEAAVEIRKAGELDALQAEMVDNTLASYWSRRYNSGLEFAKKGAEARSAGDSAQAIEQLKAAIDRFERAVVYCPDSVQNYSNLGKVFYQTGRRADALGMFDRARGLSAGRPDLQEFLLRVYVSVADMALREDTSESYRAAISLFQTALTLNPTPEDQADIHFNVGLAFSALADSSAVEARPEMHRSAEENYLQVLALSPTDAGTLQNLARLYAGMGEQAKAREMGQRLLDLEPWNPNYYLEMARLHGGADEREQRAGYMLLRSVFQDGTPAASYDVRSKATGYGPGNDMLVTLRERGEPEIVFLHHSETRGEYDVWCYWTEGRTYIFKDGHEAFRAAYKSLTREKVAELFGSPQ